MPLEGGIHPISSVRELDGGRLGMRGSLQAKGVSRRYAGQMKQGVFDKDQKQEMIRKVTDVMVDIEGEAMRGVTWVRVQEIASGEWGIGGKPLTAADVKAMQKQG